MRSGGCTGLDGVGSGCGARWRGSVARSRHLPEDRGGLRNGLCGRERSPAAPAGGGSLHFRKPGAPAGLCGGAVGVPVRVPVSRDGAVAFGVRDGWGVAPGGGYGSRTRPGSTGKVTMSRLWARRGARPRVVRDHRYSYRYLFGAACGARGKVVGLRSRTGISFAFMLLPFFG